MPAPPLTFEQPAGSALAGTALFAMPAASGAWCGYLLGRGERPPEDPIDVPSSFSSHDGHYLFALRPPPLETRDDVDRLVASAREWLDGAFGVGSPRRFAGRACVWVPDPATPAFGPPSATAFPFAWGLSGAALQADLNVPLGAQVTLSLLAGTRIAASDDGLVLTGATGANGIRFTTSPPGAEPSVEPSRASLPLGGARRGTLVLGGVLPLAATLPFFGAGVHYAHAGGPSGGPVRRRHPVLVDAGAPATPYAGAVDPLDPLNAAAGTVDLAGGMLRTVLAPAAADGGEAGPAIASWLRRANGAAVALAPLGGAGADGAPRAHAGGFALERAAAAGDPSTAVTLTLAGDWAVVTGAADPVELLWGLSGLERVAVRPRAADGAPFDRLRFTPRQPAYAPGFPFAAASPTDPARAGALLDATFRTAWATVVSGDGAPVAYVAQPESSPLFAPPGPGAPPAGAAAPPADAPLVLDWHPTVQPLPATPGFAVPLAPYAGLPDVPAEVATFESQVLAPVRRRAIATPSLPGLRAARARRLAARADGGGDAAPATVATTPQGFLVELAGDVYERVTLARSASGPDLALDAPDAELQSLLQTNQLFAVAVDPTHLGAFADAVDIAGWTMRADVGRGATASDYRNVLVLKFADGSLRERVASPAKWTDAESFSVLAGTPADGRAQALAGLSEWLQRFVDDALARAAAGDALYADFARIATDPAWRGLLVLDADVAPTDLPEQIRGLAAGIDASRFLAHHVGTTVTPVTPQGATIGIGGISSLFGLIDYELPQYRASVAAGADADLPLPLPTAAGEAYGFDVLQLQALFRNAALVDFRSRIQLTLRELFGSRVTDSVGGAGALATPAVVLRGSFQRQGAEPAYVFEQDATTVFALDSNVLETVALRRVQFNTTTPHAGEAQETIRSRFLAWGALGFAALRTSDGLPFDVLSFGDVPGTPLAERGAGLAFANLALELASPAATPAAVTYAFDASGLAFDLRASAARPDSLFPTFALQLDGFVAAPGDRRPSDLGYLMVGMEPPLELLDGPWYGVTCKVTLGTAGALVAQAGFTSRLMLAWSPQTAAGAPTYAAAAALQLPGAAPGAKLLSLQGVLKLSIDALRLQREEVAGHPGERAFTLRLSNVGLKLLGIAKLPPGATIDFFLFGDPEASGSLGWYAAYVADPRARTELTAPEAAR